MFALTLGSLTIPSRTLRTCTPALHWRSVVICKICTGIYEVVDNYKFEFFRSLRFYELVQLKRGLFASFCFVAIVIYTFSPIASLTFSITEPPGELSNGFHPISRLDQIVFSQPETLGLTVFVDILETTLRLLFVRTICCVRWYSWRTFPEK